MRIVMFVIVMICELLTVNHYVHITLSSILLIAHLVC